MRKLIALIVVLLVVFIVYNRYRLYVRDPFATVIRSGVKESGAQVYINYANDVLLENDNPPRTLEVIQHGNHAGVPTHITCLHWTACLLDADQATILADSAVPVASMTNKQVQFKDEKGDAVVTLR